MAKKNVYQFKVSLKATNSFGCTPKGKNPSIWRRIQVPESYNFHDLHLAINQAMGWLNCHLHQFKIVNPKTSQTDQIGAADDDDDTNSIPEDKVNIKEYFVSPQTTAIYEYDFGDGWVHNVIFEKIVPAVNGTVYPVCIDGKMACPPEDCGGMHGYKELLEILANPNHKEYKDRIEWLKNINRENFDPEEFDPKKFCNVYQFKISLKAVDGFGFPLEGEYPNIWRRIQVSENSNFHDLHLAIGRSMGWYDCHLHEFEIVNPKTSQTDKIGMSDEGSNAIPEEKVKIKQYFQSPLDKAVYEYDFGDGWVHDIVLEKILPAVNGLKYPVCIDGRMACPPEDCGGMHGYKELLGSLANPRHKEHKDNVTWLKRINRENFDPEEFDPKKIFKHNVYQLKISLKATNSFGVTPKGKNPNIWRRLIVHENFNFHDLHLSINEAMGWTNSHLHQFKIVNPKTGHTDQIGVADKNENDDSKLIPEETVKIKQYFISPQDKAIYEYDFGDGWVHDVVVEKILPAINGLTYPVCIEGEMACPPEDCGGMSGYRELLAILSNPKHKEYKDRISWLKRIKREDFNPHDFYAGSVEFKHTIKI